MEMKMPPKKAGIWVAIILALGLAVLQLVAYSRGHFWVPGQPYP